MIKREAILQFQRGDIGSHILARIDLGVPSGFDRRTLHDLTKGDSIPWMRVDTEVRQ